MLGVLCMMIDLLVKEVEVIVKFGVLVILLFLVIESGMKLLYVEEVYNLNGLV